jgi:hypothetical protein
MFMAKWISRTRERVKGNTAFPFTIPAPAKKSVLRTPFASRPAAFGRFDSTSCLDKPQSAIPGGLTLSSGLRLTDFSGDSTPSQDALRQRVTEMSLQLFCWKRGQQWPGIEDVQSIYGLVAPVSASATGECPGYSACRTLSGLRSLFRAMVLFVAPVSASATGECPGCSACRTLSGLRTLIRAMVLFVAPVSASATGECPGCGACRALSGLRTWSFCTIRGHGRVGLREPGGSGGGFRSPYVHGEMDLPNT